MSIDLTKVRNIGIAAHIDAGKTTTTERILFYTGRTHRMGNVDDGTTTTDFDQQEQARGITIYSAAVSCPWKDHTINLIDTPGHVDFTAEVERSLRVLDGAVAVIDAREGVEAQTETVWRQADKYHVPRLCFINKMDKLGADFEHSFESLKSRLHAQPVAMQIPMGAESTFVGMIDLRRMRAYFYDVDEQGVRFRTERIPEAFADDAARWRKEMIEKLSELSDELMEKYLGDEEIDDETILRAVRKGTIANQIQPVFCGSALKYVGVQPVLDAVCDYLPNPLDMPPVTAHDANDVSKEVKLPPDKDGPLAALVFKILAERPVDLYFLRVYSGKLKPNSRVLNAVTGDKENITRLYRMFAKRRDEITEALAGDIVAVVGLKESLTGHTICDPCKPMLLESIEFPNTVISQSVEPRSSKDRDKLEAALRAISRQDPTFQYSINEDTGQILISGMGELHLDVQVNRLRTDMNVDVRVGRPRVTYRETVTSMAEAEGRLDRQTAAKPQFASVRLSVEPAPPGSDAEEGIVDNRLPPDTISAEYVHAIGLGIRDACAGGPLAGYPVVDWKATILGAEQHDSDSSEVAFEIAARMAFDEALSKASPVLLEPIMKLEITTPEEFFGAISQDLMARRSTIVNTTTNGPLRIINSEAPLSKLFGYVTDLRSLTQGRATSTMEPSHFAAIPADEAAALLH